uniref:FBD domain-containing protein n=1 Tax=Panagrellus redivivus TaxID=6233 RepID=A0A7E5A1I6_PANRE
MPYPLEKLAYGLRRRLRELATRSEAYAFQIAAPNMAGLQPIQKVSPKFDIMLAIDEDVKLLLRFNNNIIPLQSDPFFRSSLSLEIRNFKLADSPQLILERALLSPQIVHFTNCIINSTFIRTLLSRMEGQVRNICFHHCIIPEKKVAKIFCNANAFKSLEYLIFNHSKTSMAGWIDGFLEAKTSTLREFRVKDNSASVFQINKKKFLQFFKAQHYLFKMDITISDRIIKTEKQMKALFGRHFKCQYFQPKIIQKYVIVHCGSVTRYYVFLQKVYISDDDD